MPKPASDSTVKRVHKVNWKLFKDRTGPSVEDVRQGLLLNCPLAALLAALANNPSGQAHIKRMVREHKATVETDVSGVVAELDSEGRPPGNVITSTRYFAVQLGGKTFEVSDVFCTNDGDRDSWSLIYKIH
jgi:hypothetical protein